MTTHVEINYIPIIYIWECLYFYSDTLSEHMHQFDLFFVECVIQLIDFRFVVS